MDDYRQQRRAACLALFADFQPDFAGCCDLSRAQTILRMASDGCFSYEIAETIGATPKAVQKFYRRYNFPVLQNFSPPLQDQRVGWKGGVKEVKGYLYKRSPGHPYASKHGNYVAVHRLVVEQEMGRHLLPHEVVDHIDGNPQNNHPSNLRVFQSNAEHLRETLKGRVPNWSDDGKAALDKARRQPRLKRKDRNTEPTLAE